MFRYSAVLALWIQVGILEGAKVDCREGTFGESCTNCSSRCNGDVFCDRVTGNCPNGCKSGYQDLQCFYKCSPGTYGEGCKKACSRQCIDACNHVDGSCKQCRAGWKGFGCQEECSASEWGIECRNICGKCADGRRCDSVTGRCSNGCSPGVKNSDYCNQECADGYWGVDCSERCGNCYSTSICNKTDGSCIGGCMLGFQQTRLCKLECMDGTFGVGCQHECSPNCIDMCNKVNGTCAHCAAGWKGDHCNSGCDHGEWGFGCKRHCGQCGNGSTCDRFDGFCNKGCMPGHSGDLCNTGTGYDTQTINTTERTHQTSSSVQTITSAKLPDLTSPPGGLHIEIYVWPAALVIVTVTIAFATVCVVKMCIQRKRSSNEHGQNDKAGDIEIAVETEEHNGQPNTTERTLEGSVSYEKLYQELADNGDQYLDLTRESPV